MKKGKPSVNPKGRKGKAKDIHEDRVDGYQSTFTGLGISGYDKRVNTSFQSDRIDRNLAMQLWTGDDIAARAVDIPVEDAFRQGFKFTGKAKDGADVDIKELQDLLLREWQNRNVLEVGQKALGYDMAYGGSGTLFGFDGMQGTELQQPRNLEANRELTFLNVLEPGELPVKFHYLDPFLPKYGMPHSYRFSPLVFGVGEGGGRAPNSMIIHESHMHVMRGIQVSKSLQNPVDPGWGESVYTRLWRVLRDFNVAWGGVGNLLVDFSQTVMKLKNLAQLLSETGGAGELKSRLQGMDQGRSILRAIVIDAEESVERHTTNVSGLAELLESYMARVSSAAGGIPITKLFGVAPSGLNSSGDSDIAQWDDRVKSIQDKKVIPYLTTVTQLIVNSGKLPGVKGLESWKIEAHPLRQPTEDEIATTRNKQAQTDQIYIMNGVVSPDDVANSRFGGDMWSMDTVIDWEARKALQAALLESGDDATLEDEDDEDAPGRTNKSKESDKDEDSE
jgi:phage-related protein (TIGR01555 family)